MTKQEALKVLKKVIMCETDTKIDCFNINCVNCPHNHTAEERLEAIKVAAEILEGETE